MANTNGNVIKFVARYVLPLVVAAAALTLWIYSSQAAQDEKISKNREIVGRIEEKIESQSSLIIEIKERLGKLGDKIESVGLKVKGLSVVQEIVRDDVKDIKMMLEK